jgi:hypothetical protein
LCNAPFGFNVELRATLPQYIFLQEGLHPWECFKETALDVQRVEELRIAVTSLEKDFRESRKHKGTEGSKSDN